MWVRSGGPAIGFKFSRGADEAPDELSGRSMFPGIAEGWAWSDEDRGQLVHLDLPVFHQPHFQPGLRAEQEQPIFRLARFVLWLPPSSDQRLLAFAGVAGLGHIKR